MGSKPREITWEINENDCWICTSHAPNYYGYPVIKRNGKKIILSRYMHEKYKNKIPENMCVCHKCDIRKCINPDHLFLGTIADNIEDMVKKGRNSKGENRPTAKLSTKQAYKIKFGHNNLLYKEIAKLYNVSIVTIGRIKSNKSWKHLKKGDFKI